MVWGDLVLVAMCCASLPVAARRHWTHCISSINTSLSTALQPSVPQVPNYRLSMTIPDWLQAIQTYMKTLQYPSNQGLGGPRGDGRGDLEPPGRSVPGWSANAP